MQQLTQPIPHVAPPMDCRLLTTLTPREREVATLVAEGLSNAQIAERLVLTSGTVANHLAHITRALGVRNRVQVAVWAVEQGLYSSGRSPNAEPPTEIRPYRSGRAD
jgi:DNA-binding NarL/FixJ family response regulator